MDNTLVRNSFQKYFSTSGDLYFSPGRINLIGEHTDYNGGFVLPGAIDKGILAETKPHGKDIVRAYSVDHDEYDAFGLEESDNPAPS